MSAVVLAYHTGVNFSATNKPITINGMVIERNLRSRRKLDPPDVPEVKVQRVGKCAVLGCSNKGVALEKDNVTSYFCTIHVRVPMRQGWVEVDV